MRTEPQEIYNRCGALLLQQHILAIKGLGGFHLACDASNEETIERLRHLKRRPTKPFAVMMRDIHQVKQYFNLSEAEKKQLQRPEAPIVLLPKRRTIQPLPEQLAPGVGKIGIMLAYTPVHYLLLTVFNRPLVMTSGNGHGAPVCTNDRDAFDALENIADLFLTHNRRITFRCDDSLLDVIADKPRIIRRARGFTPTPITLQTSEPPNAKVLAMGADLKNCFALSKDSHAVLSAHNGDLHNVDCFNAFADSINSHKSLYKVMPDTIVIDMHPDYISSKFGKRMAHETGSEVMAVQHHHAHVVSCLMENSVPPNKSVLGIVLDGLGYGDDNSLWGGEFLLANYSGYHRLASLHPFPLLGGEAANYEPWRNLLSLLTEGGLYQYFCGQNEHIAIAQQLDSQQAKYLIKHRRHFPHCSSIGRLFDGVAALLGVAPLQLSYEGEAAIKLEAVALSAQSEPLTNLPPLDFTVEKQSGLYRLNPISIWKPMIDALIKGTHPGKLALAFHLALVDGIVNVVKSLTYDGATTFSEVALSGGVFQNSIIQSQLIEKLTQCGYKVYSHSNIPSNDGGIALGQIGVAMAKKSARKES